MRKAILMSLALLSILTFNSIAQVTWVQQSDIGTLTRYEAVGFAIGEKGYVCTGRCHEADQYLKDMWEYDPQDGTWTQKADFPAQERKGAIGFAIGGKAYVGLGFYSEGWTPSYFDDMWEYDPLTNHWTQKGDFPGGARYLSNGFATETKGYVVAGTYGTEGAKEVWEYEPTTDNWTQKQDYPGIRFTRLAGFVIGVDLFLGCGGIDTLNEFWQFNTLADIWTKKTPIPYARFGAVGFSIGDIGYIGTGDEGAISKTSTDLSLNDFWKYDPETDSWTEQPGLNAGDGRSYAIGFSIGQKGYVGTGIDDGGWWVNYLNDFWELDFFVNTEEIPRANTCIMQRFGNTLIVTSPDRLKELTIIDLLGHTVIKLIPIGCEMTIDLSTFRSGVYVVKACDAKNRYNCLKVTCI